MSPRSSTRRPAPCRSAPTANAAASPRRPARSSPTTSSSPPTAISARSSPRSAPASCRSATTSWRPSRSASARRRPDPPAGGVADTRFVVHYWRLSTDGRVVGWRRELRPAGAAQHRHLRARPHAQDLSAARRRPHRPCLGRHPGGDHEPHAYFRRLKPGLSAAAGYFRPRTGHRHPRRPPARRGDRRRHRALRRDGLDPAGKFPGGPLFRLPTLVLAMSWFALRDRL